MPNKSETRALSRLDELGRTIRRARVSTAPDAGSAIGEMAISIVLPGVAALRRSLMSGVALFVVGVVLPMAVVAWTYTGRDDLIGLALDPTFLLYVTGLALAAVVARLLAIAEIADAFRRSPGIGAQTAVATLVVLALGSPALWVAYRSNEARAQWWPTCSRQATASRCTCRHRPVRTSTPTT